MAEVATVGSLQEIPTDQIHVDPGQPRRSVEHKDLALEGLADSIRHVGILVPLLLRQGSEGTYRLVAGHRRLRAAQAIGLPTVPAIIRDISDQEARTVQVVENLQREDLSALEEAQGYRSLLELGLSQREVGERVGRTQAHVSATVRLLELPAFVLNALHTGKLTPRHGRAFLPLAGHPKILQAVAAGILSGDVDPAENLEAQLPWMIRREAGDQVRPLSREAYWGPKNPLGGQGALFRPGDALPLKRLTPILQGLATAEGTFYHPGPCTTCPHGFRAKTRDGVCLDPAGTCYGIRQAFAASGPLKIKVARAGRQAEEQIKAGKARNKKERDRQARAAGLWAKAVAKALAHFRRRPARPRDLYLRALCEKLDDWQMKPARIAVLLGPDLETFKMKPAAVKEKPLPVLARLSERRLQEVLRMIYAVEDAGRRSWRGKAWPFTPPVKGLARWGV
ncbi:MAG: ParB/RepB/Spo0J family partition protein [Anaerolineales bacterium]